MKNKNKIWALAAIAALAMPAMADEYTEPLTELAKGKIHEIAQNPELVAAIKAQNEQTGSYDQAKIDSLDQKWRAEVDAADHPMIDDVLANPTSEYLMKVLDESQGLFTEIFAMDAKGLNVGQSGITSDYWQGDEGKWQNTYGVGPDAVDISEIELDDSTQTYQSQVSIPVVDENGQPIGAITFGVNVDEL